MKALRSEAKTVGDVRICGPRSKTERPRGRVEVGPYPL